MIDTMLVCTECGTVAEDGLGRRAYLIGVPDELDDEKAVAFVFMTSVTRR